MIQVTVGQGVILKLETSQSDMIQLRNAASGLAASHAGPARRLEHTLLGAQLESQSESGPGRSD